MYIYYIKMFKILILCFITFGYCSPVNWFSGELGNDKCLTNSDRNNGYYCKIVYNTCYIECSYLTKCGYCRKWFIILEIIIFI